MYLSLQKFSFPCAVRADFPNTSLPLVTTCHRRHVPNLVNCPHRMDRSASPQPGQILFCTFLARFFALFGSDFLLHFFFGPDFLWYLFGPLFSYNFLVRFLYALFVLTELFRPTTFSRYFFVCKT